MQGLPRTGPSTGNSRSTAEVSYGEQSGITSTTPSSRDSTRTTPNRCGAISSPGSRTLQLHSDSQSKANILLRQFKSVFTRTTTTTLPNLKPPPAHIQPITITAPGVAKLLRDLKVSKAPGPDGIPNVVLKTLADNIAPSLTLIFQSSLESGRLPQDWLTANVSSAFKKDDGHTPATIDPSPSPQFPVRSWSTF